MHFLLFSFIIFRSMSHYGMHASRQPSEALISLRHYPDWLLNVSFRVRRCHLPETPQEDLKPPSDLSRNVSASKASMLSSPLTELNQLGQRALPGFGYLTLLCDFIVFGVFPCLATAWSTLRSTPHHGYSSTRAISTPANLATWSR